MTPAERAVVEAAVSRGYLTPEQVAQATQGAEPGSVLPRLSSQLSDAQKSELVSLYRSASGRTDAALDQDALRTQIGSGPGISATNPSPSAPSAPSVRLEPGARLGDFELLEELGRGGMGVVYRARSVSLEREVALKVLIPTGIEDEEGRAELIARFQVEAKAAARLRHPNIVGVLQQGQDGAGRWFMAMDLIQGESLDHSLMRDGALLPEEAAQIVLKAARALAYAHEQDVLHRDLKPHNIIVDEESGEPLITDFGLAKLVGNQQHSLTRTGAGLLGTPAYMPPEQADSAKSRIDARGDVYSLGATLFHLLTGRPPFVGETVANILIHVISEDPPAPRSLVPEIPADLETICLKTLEKDPDDRYPSADAFADDLERFLQGEPISARPPSLGRRAQRWAQRNRALAGVVAVCAAVVLLTIGAAAKAVNDAARREVAAAPPPPIPAPAKTDDAELEELRKQLDAKEAAKQAAEAKAKAAELRARREARAKAEAERRAADERERSAQARAEAEALARKAAERTREEAAARRARPKTSDPSEDASGAPVEKKVAPAPKPSAPQPVARYEDGMNPDLRSDGPPPAWLVHRLRIRRSMRLRKKVHWARTTQEAVTEARARNVPLVIVQGRPNLSTLRGVKRARALFVEDAVGLLAQGPHRLRPGVQVVVAAKDVCPWGKAIRCTQHMNAAWWLRMLRDGKRFELPAYDAGLPPSVVEHNNDNRPVKKGAGPKPAPRTRGGPMRGPRGGPMRGPRGGPMRGPRGGPMRGPRGPRPGPPHPEELEEGPPPHELQPRQPAEVRPLLGGRLPESLRNAQRLGDDAPWSVHVCHPGTLSAAASFGPEVDPARLRSAVAALQATLGAPRDPITPYLAPALKRVVGKLLAAERRLEEGKVSAGYAALLRLRKEQAPRAAAWVKGRLAELPSWCMAWIERQRRRGPELARARLGELELPSDSAFAEARAARGKR